MVKIRLRRVGAKKQPHYRIVVADARSPRDGKFLETIGHYNPRTEPPTVEVDTERALYWLSVGAQPTEAVRRLLDKTGILARAAAIKRGEVPVDIEAEIEPAVEEAEEALPVEAEPVEAEGEEFALAEEELAQDAVDEDVLADAEEEEAEDDESEEDLLDEDDESEDDLLDEGDESEEDLLDVDAEVDEDLLDEDEELDEPEDDWEPEISEAEESDDLDDWELDVKEDDDVDDDQPLEKDDE
jgi:small subunit ribosomal protein S16